jgi:hypothetical protein
MELTHTDKCHLGYAMFQLPSNGAWCLFSLIWSRKSWRYSWTISPSMEKPSTIVWRI